MDKKTKQKIFSIRDLLKYSAQRAYFGKLTGAGLADAYGLFKHSQDWDKPITSAKVSVGKIDGSVICGALWNEMSYNPVRFGKVSPFMYKGKEDIYHFCRCSVPETFPGFQVIEKIRHKMIDFLMLNGRAKGEWHDVINTQNGTVTINFIDGHSDDNYKALTKLREMIRIVVSQNLEDFKHKAYRMQMLTVINKKHPNGIRDNTATVSEHIQKPHFLPLSEMEEDTPEDILDREIERDQITASNRKYVPKEQYKQACENLKAFKEAKKYQK